MELKSCLYECSVMHHRLEPRKHHFRYNIFMLCLDLDEIDLAVRSIPLLSRNRFNLYTFRDDDHIQWGATKVKENLIAYLAQHGISFPPNGRIMLITLPRVLGYIFNPVSFYFCFDADGAPLCSVVEVGNTFREMKPYLIREPSENGLFRLVTPKHFYVSPFSKLELDFDFKLRVPGDSLEIFINDLEEGRRVLLTSLVGRRVPLSTARLAWFTLKYPLLTLRVIFLIHWHALLLWLKRVAFYQKHDRPDLQRDVLRPHSSIAPKKK